MGAKKADKIAALCSAAIGVIYVTGYFVTDPAVAALATGDRPAAVAPADQNQNQTPNQNPNQTRKHGNRGQNFGGPGMQGTQGSQIPEQGRWQDNAEWPQNQQPSTSQGQTTSPSALSGTYKDGTYTGSGTNRIGTVEVAVTIKSGKISAVEITNCNTHYPQSRIDGLPAQALKNQSDQVNNVSGATMSTTDFRTAVRQALQQAQA